MPDKPISLTCSDEEIAQLKALAGSTTAGLWRIKRAKVLLGTLEGTSVVRLMHQVCVPAIVRNILCRMSMHNLIPGTLAQFSEDGE